MRRLLLRNADCAANEGSPQSDAGNPGVQVPLVDVGEGELDVLKVRNAEDVLDLTTSEADAAGADDCDPDGHDLPSRISWHDGACFPVGRRLSSGDESGTQRERALFWGVRDRARLVASGKECVSMKRALLRSELLLVVVVMLVLGTGGRGGDAARPTHSSQRAVMPAHRPQPTIVFSSARDGQKRHYDIYVAIQHASRVRQFEIRRLTDHPRGASWPSWSPDGNRIAFMSKRHDPGEDIYTMKVDGTNVVRLTNTPALDWYPRWSPNGNYIAWARCSGSGFNVWVMDADGSNPHALTHLATTDDQPDWAPSSTRVVFRSKRDGTYEIYRMKTDGTELMRLTNNPAEDSNPAWSPDSQRIAFTRRVSGGKGDIFVMEKDGSNLTQVTNHPDWDVQPRWSPDSQRLIFASLRDGNWNIYTMKADGTDAHKLISSSAVDWEADWLIPR